MDLSLLASLDAPSLRMLLPGYLSGFYADKEAKAANRARMVGLVEGWDDAACQALLTDLSSAGQEMSLYRANPHARTLSRLWSQDAVVSWTVAGVEHVEAAAAAGPTIVLCNHLSYYDATATDAILDWAGHGALADRLLFAAGPKVYQHLFRRVAAVCLNTVKVPQSTKFAHTERIPARELARLARSSMDAATGGMAEGMVLLLYPEGSRTRSGHMGSFLKGVRRYVSALEGVRIVPMTIVGTDKLMGVEDDERIVPSTVSIEFLPAIEVGPALAPRDALVQCHGRIAQALPPHHRPEPGLLPLV